MKKIILLLIFILTISPIVYAATINVKFVWDRNTEKDLAGYRMYQSDISGDYSMSTMIDIPGDPNSYITQIDATSDQYFVITAYDTSGLESDYSNQVILNIDTNAPDPVKGYYIKQQTIINFY